MSRQTDYFFRRRRIAACTLLLALLKSATAESADLWTLRTSDLANQSVLLRGIGSEGLTVVIAPATQPSTVPVAQFLSLDRPGNVLPQSGLTLDLQNGDALTGEPISLDGETLRWRESTLGPMSLPIARVRQIRRSQHANNQPQSLDAATDDVAALSNGDVVRGAVASLTDKTINLQKSDGTAVPIPVESLRSLHFAATGQPSSAPARNEDDIQLKLFDGSIVSGSALKVILPLAELSRADRDPLQIPLEAIQSIEQVDGPVAWLSESVPSENVQTPLFDRSQPAKFDRAVTGAKIRYGNQVFEHGIGVHAYSRLVWPIGPRDQVFRTQFAVAGDAPYACVTVRIKVDDRLASETKGFRAGVLSPVILIDVAGAHQLTLEVEAANDDVQGRLNWIEPALLRFKPATTQQAEATTSP